MPAELLVELNLINERFESMMRRRKTTKSFTVKTATLLHEIAGGYDLVGRILFDFYKTEDLLILKDELPKLILTINARYNINQIRITEILLQILESNLYMEPERDDIIINYISETGHNVPSLFLKILKIRLRAFYNSNVIDTDKNDDENDPKISFQDKDVANDMKKISNNSNIYNLCAFLIHRKLIDFNELFTYFEPNGDDTYVESFEKDFELAKLKVSKIGVVSFSSKKKKEVNDPNKVLQFIHNQKLSLLGSLIEHNLWNEADIILDKFENLEPSSHPDVYTALCNVLHVLIEPFNQLISKKFLEGNNEKNPIINIYYSINNNDDNTNILNLMEHIFRILKHLNCYIYTDNTLFHKLLVVVIEYVKNYKKNNNDLKTDENYIISKKFHYMIHYNILCAYLLVEKNNNTISSLIYQLLKLFPTSIRHLLYNFCEDEAYTQNSILMIKKVEIAEKVKYFRKRLSAKDSKSDARALIKFAIHNPVYVFNELLQQIAIMDNLIISFIDSLKYTSDFMHDIIIYLLIKRFSSSRDKIKDDGINEVNWLQSLSTFLSHLYLKYENLDLDITIKYIINVLKNGQTADLVILKKIISLLGNINISEEISEHQLNSLAGSIILQKEAFNVEKKYQELSEARKSRKMEQLLSSLDLLTTIANNDDNEEIIFIKLISLISQAKYNIIYDTESSHSKYTSELLDKTHHMLLQLSTLLRYNYDNLDIKFPSLNDLIFKYLLNPVEAFEFFRITNTYTTLNNKKFTQECKNIILKHYNYNKITEFSLSMNVYKLFWFISQQDLYIPEDSYNKEIQKFEKNKKLSNKIILFKEALNKQKVKKEQIDIQFEKIIKKWNKKGIDELLQWCIKPRLLFSNIDSIYCSEFIIKLLTIIDDISFTIEIYNQIITFIVPALSSCTTFQASRLARFLTKLWIFINNKFINDNKDIASELQTLDQKLIKQIISCIKSGHRLIIGNSLKLLNSLGYTFPSLRSIGINIMNISEQIMNNPDYKNDSIQVLATQTYALYNSKKDNWYKDCEFPVIKSKAKKVDNSKINSEKNIESSSKDKKSKSNSKKVLKK